MAFKQLKDLIEWITEYHETLEKQYYSQDVEVDDEFRNRMVLDVLEYLKTQDPTLVFRRSCREGVCGSDGLSINGRNGLGCITNVADALGKKNVLEIRPLPGMPVIRDLVVDQSLFFKQYERVMPWLINDTPKPAVERLQSPEDRAKLDGLYECILCACCTSACPSWWWNPEKYIGPSGLLQAYRFLLDSRDTATSERLAKLEDPFSVFRCRTIGNCTAYCPRQAMADVAHEFDGYIYDLLETRRQAGAGAPRDVTTSLMEEFLSAVDTLEPAPDEQPERAPFPTGGFSYLPMVIGKR